MLAIYVHKLWGAIAEICIQLTCFRLNSVPYATIEYADPLLDRQATLAGSYTILVKDEVYLSRISLLCALDN